MNAMIKAGKDILNALAFANVGNYREFHALLRQTDRRVVSEDRKTQYRLVSDSTDSPAITPAAHTL
jgi:hypothetical protein